MQLERLVSAVVTQFQRLRPTSPDLSAKSGNPALRGRCWCWPPIPAIPWTLELLELATNSANSVDAGVAGVGCQLRQLRQRWSCWSWPPTPATPALELLELATNSANSGNSGAGVAGVGPQLRQLRHRWGLRRLVVTLSCYPCTTGSWSSAAWWCNGGAKVVRCRQANVIRLKSTISTFGLLDRAFFPHSWWGMGSVTHAPPGAGAQRPGGEWVAV